ncbi:AAA family ATPase [Candidatus Fermentibacteria bacterium]|nr:MAG: AAA family ATPase [Candidatus Fermentibacteria bacterium]
MEPLRLKRLIEDQRQEFLAKKPGVIREVKWRDLLSLERILAVTGIRRAGKSTLLRQIAEEEKYSFAYLNFDDIRLSGFQEDDYTTILSSYSALSEKTVFLFDEIQMAPAWERFLRRLHDIGRMVVVTGSNTSILSDELGSHLTGRYLKQELFPFSFREYLRFCGNSQKMPVSTAEADILLKCSIEYMENGGFPEYLPNQRRELLEHLFIDIITRDIIARHGIQGRSGFRDLALYLMSHAGCRMSYGKLAGTMGFRSATSAKEYLGFMEDAYLLFQLRRFDWSLKRSMLSPRKIYPIDNGLSSAVSFNISPDRGHKLETAVFLELKRNGEVWYYSGKSECDFIAGNSSSRSCIQVCWYLDNENRQRELRGLNEAMDFFKLNTGTIVTLNQEEVIEENSGKRISVVPFWKWALDHN